MMFFSLKVASIFFFLVWKKRCIAVVLGDRFMGSD